MLLVLYLYLADIITIHLCHGQLVSVYIPFEWRPNNFVMMMVVVAVEIRYAK